MRLAGAILAACLAAACSPGIARAQMDSREAIALQNEILELRSQVQSIQDGRPAQAPVRRGGGGGGADPALLSQFLDRIATLEEQVRTLRGQVETLQNQQQRMGEDLGKQISDLKFAMQSGAPQGSSQGESLGQSAAQAASPAARPQSPPASSLGTLPQEQAAQPVPPRTPERAMQEANAALARRDYSAAEAAAREVVAKGGPRAADAQFVLAQAEMGRRNYQQAAPDFYDAYNRSRTGPRAQDSLLGVANALVALGDRQSACDALVKLKAEFPRPRGEVRDGMASVRSRAACR